MTVLKRAGILTKGNTLVILCKKNSDFRNSGLSASATDTIKKAIDQDRRTIQAYSDGQLVFALVKGEKESPAKIMEGIRKAGAALISIFNDNRIKSISILDADKKDEHLLALAEGITLSNYQFLNYKVSNKEKRNKFTRTDRACFQNTERTAHPPITDRNPGHLQSPRSCE